MIHFLVKYFVFYLRKLGRRLLAKIAYLRKKSKYILLDEVQHVNEFEDVLNSYLQALGDWYLSHSKITRCNIFLA